MINNDILGTVREIFRDIFDDPDLMIDASTNSESISDWDSLNHINLVTSIEKEFGIRFSLGELEALKNVGDILILIEEKR
jgi:acyl carrier protein